MQARVTQNPCAIQAPACKVSLALQVLLPLLTVPKLGANLERLLKSTIRKLLPSDAKNLLFSICQVCLCLACMLVSSLQAATFDTAAVHARFTIHLVLFMLQAHGLGGGLMYRRTW
jgi:hypothetical protein